ncbi:hypothetical protein [Salinispora vitiensis]|nr:hypothetical protein [Salinispora vitiensis]
MRERIRNAMGRVGERARGLFGRNRRAASTAQSGLSGSPVN